jgi:ABC-type branched-subunit amino acid transport system ATPase component
MTEGSRAVNGLSVASLTVRFGGHTAVDGLDLEASAGRLNGLIGPNGAGKTTTFNACTGLLRPTAGRVHFKGRDVTSLGPAARARLGLGRTFQRMELWASMSVAENVALGVEAGLAGANPFRHLIPRRRERTHLGHRVDEALNRCGLEDIAGRPAGALSTGQRRLLELARAIACGFDVLLLDEPSSGLDHAESARMGQILRRLVDEAGTGILLVEHDMALVMSVCDYLYVLDFGELIFEGTPAETMSSPAVRSAYLGSEEGLETAMAERERADQSPTSPVP